MEGTWEQQLVMLIDDIAAIVTMQETEAEANREKEMNEELSQFVFVFRIFWNLPEPSKCFYCL